MARPRKQIDKKQFEALCHMLCTEEEICSILDITDKPLNRWCKEQYNAGFSEIYKKLSQYGKMSVRRNLLKLSERNASACIFLAKNLLGYTDDGIRKADEKTADILQSINEILLEDDDEVEQETEAIN